MLEELRLSSVGVISRAHATFHPGLTALTGETGAGKTMVLTGLGLIMGARSDAALVRRGAPAAEVEGIISAANGAELERVAQDVGGLLDDGALLFSRTVPREGRARATLAGKAVPAARLAEVAGSYVTVHGQADQLRLRSGAQQRQALDEYAQLEGALREHRALFERWRAAEAELEDWAQTVRLRAAEREMLTRGLEAIDAVSPQPGEDDELKAEAERLSNVDELRGSLQLAAESLGAEERGAVALLSRSARQLAACERYGTEYHRWSQALESALAGASDVASEVTAALNELGADPQRLEQVHARRAEISALLRSHGPTIAHALAWAEEARERLKELGEELSSQELDELVRKLREDLVSSAQELTRRRRKAAKALASKVNGELAALAMKGATFAIALRAGELTALGADEITMTLSPHPGADPLPVARSASGGELSRIMLALEVALAAPGGEHTFVFDEVDAGIGGAAAVEVGRRLKSLAASHQVIVVTHLAQVAAFADRHLVVEKATTGKAAATKLRAVEGEDRLAELARMLAGNDTPAALRHAAELLERAQIG